MFNWENCPSELYDKYIEVGEVKRANFNSEECVFIEIWIATVFSNNWSRSECKTPVRRPIYGVLKQIRKLCGNKAACVIIMCDDVYDDTVHWGGSLSLLLQQLKGEEILKHSMLYTKSSKDRIMKREQTKKWRNNREKDIFLSLFEILDVIIFEQANCYSKQENSQIQAKNSRIPLLLSKYIQLTKNEI